MALATTALTLAHGRASTNRSTSRRLTADLDRATTEIALLKEELDIKDDRWSRLPSRRRPYYLPVQRMRILQLKAARGWSCEQAARAFLINEQTLCSWMRRVDEQGERSLIQIAEPVNRFPHFVRYLVQQLSVLLPTMGKVRIAQVLARAGLHLGATTVGRMLKEREPLSPDDTDLATIEVTTRVVTAKCPGHVWHVDLTTVPTSAGFWVPWLPYARSLLSSATWKAGNICPSLNCAELLEQVLGADLWRLPRRQQCALILKVRQHRACRRAQLHARARNRDGGQTMAADSGAS